MRVFTVAIAIAVGLFVLAGYFFPILTDLQIQLINWAIIIAGTAVLVGIFHMAAVQMEKFRARQKGGMYGLLLVLSMLATFIAVLAELVLGSGHLFTSLAVDAIIVPVEASLMAILAITLIYAGIRLLRRRVDVMSVVFLVAAIIFLIVFMPTPFTAITPVQDAVLSVAGWFSQGGARGLLIGIALGTVLTGLRVLFGVDRPYGGN